VRNRRLPSQHPKSQTESDRGVSKNGLVARRRCSFTVPNPNTHGTECPLGCRWNLRQGWALISTVTTLHTPIEDTLIGSFYPILLYLSTTVCLASSNTDRYPNLLPAPISRQPLFTHNSHSKILFLRYL
jgi:hypothetical protein